MSRTTWVMTAAVMLTASGLAAAPVPPDKGEKPRVADAKQRLRSQNNLKEIVLALHNYESAYGHFPGNVTDKNGKPLLSWRVAILPYIEQNDLYQQFKMDEPWDSENNKKLLPKMPDVFRVGFEEKGEWRTHYQGFAGPGTVFDPRNKVRITAITDGTSNTLAVVEAGPPVEWTKPADIPFDPQKPLPKLEGPFANVLAAATADGAAHKLRRDFDEKKFRQLVGAQDGEVVDVGDFRAKFPLTAEDAKIVQELIKENEKAIAAVAEQLKEQQKLLLEELKQPKPRADIDDLVKMNRDLQRSLEHLKRKTDEMKGQIRGEVPPPPAIKK